MSDPTVTIKEYFERILEEKDKAINIALAAAKEAVGVAENNAEKWRANANEWRGAMTDREKMFIPRVEFEAYKSSVDVALRVQKEQGDINKGKGDGVHAVWGFIVGMVGLIGGLVSVFYALSK